MNPLLQRGIMRLDRNLFLWAAGFFVWGLIAGRGVPTLLNQSAKKEWMKQDPNFASIVGRRAIALLVFIGTIFIGIPATQLWRPLLPKWQQAVALVWGLAPMAISTKVLFPRYGHPHVERCATNHEATKNGGEAAHLEAFDKMWSRPQKSR